MNEVRLPVDLQVGVATASWQVEGAVAERGPSIWDDFAAVPGAIRDGTTGEPACDHLRRVTEDLDLMAWLGVDAYRFSVSWPRVQPGGTGAVSPAGLDFYDRLVDGLLERGIAPAATLYHWDLPSQLQAAGGWPERRTAERFAEFADILGRRLGDRVERWATLNEPWCSAFLGYAAGIHAPGVTDPQAAFAAAYHLIWGHGLAMSALRAAGCREVGIVLNLIPVLADDPTDPACVAAAEHVDSIQNRLFLDLLAGRGVPTDLREATSGVCDWSFLNDADTATLSGPLDWLGENYYTIHRVTTVPSGGDDGDAVGQHASAFPGGPPHRFAPRPPLTQMGWEIAPTGLGDALRSAAAALPGVPLWITENGMAGPDSPEVTGDGTVVHDVDRVDYYRAHVQEVLRCRQDGLDLRGYYAWSLLDNIEWAEGWTKRFGIVRVEPGTLSRLPKDSAHWWRERLAERSAAG